MAATKKMQVEEALNRLEILETMGLHPNVKLEFERNGLLNYSERTSFGGHFAGALYWIADGSPVSRSGKAFSDVVKAFEAEYNAVVYHATHEHTKFGEILDLFYVSENEDRWKLERAGLSRKAPIVWVENLDDPYVSEFDLICFEQHGGGIVRTG